MVEGDHHLRKRPPIPLTCLEIIFPYYDSRKTDILLSHPFGTKHEQVRKCSKSDQIEAVEYEMTSRTNTGFQHMPGLQILADF